MTKIKIAEKVLRLAISVIGFPLTFVQTILSRYTIHKYKQLGEMINVGNHSLHAIVTGEDNHLPTFIELIVISGLSLSNVTEG